LFHKQVFVKSPLVHALGDALICSVASLHQLKSNIRTATRQEAEGGTSGASSSSSDAASSPPRCDGGAPHKIPSNSGGSDVSRVVREFNIGKIRASAVVVVDPSHCRCRRSRRTRGAPFWRWRRWRLRPLSRSQQELVGDKREANSRRREWRGGE
jgi:hypothetical protein